jgi:hypothetical protein
MSISVATGFGAFVCELRHFCGTSLPHARAETEPNLCRTCIA